MNKVKIVFLILAVISGLLSILTFIPNEVIGFELRLKEYILLYDGPIQFMLISATSFLLLILFTIRKNKELIIVFLIVTVFSLVLIYLFSLLDFGPQVKEDRIVYQNISNDSEKLIFQYYEVGITGNPRWKAIITNNISGNIKRIKNINIRPLREKIDVGDHSINLKKLPTSIELNNNLYALKKVMMFSNDSIINYK
jgi:hypothetical protein